jgi:hypothetical protein
VRLSPPVAAQRVFPKLLQTVEPEAFVITGFNTDIEHAGITYHIQTEDKGLKTPLILSLVYVGGTILASKRTSYQDLIDSGFEQKELAERLQRQHKLICAAVRAGRIEDLKRLGERGTGARTSAKSAPPPQATPPTPPSGDTIADATAPLDIVQTPPTQSAETDVETSSPVIEISSPVVETSPPVVETPAPVAPALIFESYEAMSLNDPDAYRPTHEMSPPPPPLTSVTVEPEALIKPDAPAEPVTESPVKQEEIGVGQDAGDDFYIRLLDDEAEFRAGELVMIRIHVGRGKYGNVPVRDAAVTVKVLGTTFRPLIVSTETDDDGIAIVRALLPRFTSGRAAILIRAHAGEHEAELRRIIKQA